MTKLVVADEQRPPCFSTDVQFKEWRLFDRALKASGGSSGRDSYCADCTPEFKREQVRIGACSFPAVWFSVDKDGAYEGRRGATRFKPKRDYQVITPIAA